MKTLVPTVLALSVVLGPAKLTAAADRPNVLLIYADDLGYNELSCYGGKHVPTPNIDSIAARGVRCTQGYVSAPLCSPSRAGLMTGRYPTRYGHENNEMAPGGLPLTEVTMADRMKALGYATGMVGKWHLGHAPDRLPTARGFGEYYGVIGNPGSYFKPNGFIDSRLATSVRPVGDPEFYTTDAFAARSVDWIERHKDGPWFLYLPFNAVHAPRDAPDKYLRRFADVPNKADRTLFAMTAAMDDAVGAVLAKVRELGQDDRTIVVFISDNGAPNHPDGNDPLRGRKNTAWEGGIRIPFMIRWPGHLPAGVVYDKPVVQLDMMPTFLAAAGAKVEPSWKLDGVDLLPYLSGANLDRPHQTLFWKIDGKWAIRHGDWKLVHGGPGDDAPELFDLAADLREQHDLAAAKPDQVKELKARWDAWDAEQASKARNPAKVARKAARKKAKKADNK
ncbi:sulfatase family protein [Singulisphaera sp. PoT]|uniref:sulfatase family protein n=1 Tax=Singulisphaera sp. PoT TaxID=3411797 RepID=UPI003BF5EE4E